MKSVGSAKGGSHTIVMEQPSMAVPCYVYAIQYSDIRQRSNISIDGYLMTIPSSGWTWLQNSKKETIRKGIFPKDVRDSIYVGNILTCAGYTIKVLSELDRKGTLVENTDKILITQQVSNCDKKRKNSDVNTLSLENTKNAKVSIHLDIELQKMMRPHQIEGATFLLSRLLGGCNDRNANCDLIDKDIISVDLPLVTGAILADEMGTGKTLTSLAVLWSICRKGCTKGVIVAPSSLIGNWEAEIKKWLPLTLGKSALYVTKTANFMNEFRGPDAIVYRFINSHPSIHPLLVISYDMFRSFADALNTLNSLEVLICDEGHRLKNALGTKTTISLGKCIATKRLVLTGTPIQNNLDELYAVVNFAAPGFIGSLIEFKTKYADIIQNSRLLNATEEQKNLGTSVMLKLKNHLSSIFMRRSSDSVFKSILPPKREFIMYCFLQTQQQEQYRNECTKIISELSQNECNDKTFTRGILPNLLKLRIICSTGKKQFITTENVKVQSNDNELESGKLKLLANLLFTIKNMGTEKVVIASNFLDTLNDIAKYISMKRWSFLRIDGSTPSSNRRGIVDSFNNGNAFIMLLSTKAGGVGLNLISASRLILMEPDWNPATDLQAMGRIWRFGQTRACFIYRFIAHGTIDESILTRQSEKSGLAGLMKYDNSDGSSDTDEFENRESDLITNLGTVNISSMKTLVYPLGEESFNKSILPNVEERVLNEDSLLRELDCTLFYAKVDSHT